MPTPNFNAIGGAAADAGQQILDPLKAFAEVAKDFAAVVSAVLDPFDQLRDTLGDVAKSIKGGLSPLFESLGHTFKDVGGRIGGVFSSALKSVPDSVKQSMGRIGETAGQAVGGVGKAFGAVGKAALGAATAVMEIGNQLAQFVRLASPAVFQQFLNVLDDVQALIGQAFTPILQIATQIIRSAADALQTLVPIGQAVAAAIRPLVTVFTTLFQMAAYRLQPVIKIVEMFAPIVSELGNALGALFQAAQPIFNLLVEVAGSVLIAALKPLAAGLAAIVPHITAFAMVLRDVVEWVVSGIKEMLAFIGLGLTEFDRPRAGGSIGAAAKSASIGSVESLGTKAITSAYSLGSAASTPASRTATAAEELRKKAEEIHHEIRAFPETLKAEVSRLIEALLKKPGEVIREGAKGVAEATRSPVGRAAVSAVIPGAGALLAADDFTGGRLGRFLGGS